MILKVKTLPLRNSVALFLDSSFYAIDLCVFPFTKTTLFISITLEESLIIK